MQLGASGFSSSSTDRPGISLGLAKNRNSLGLTPSSEVDSRKVFDEVINNNNVAWTQLKDNVDKDFSLPNTPIFNVDYEGQDVRFIVDQIVKHRIVPILQSSTVKRIRLF
jgi:hypothetical protein